MTRLVTALQTNTALTQNGMPTHTSSLSKLVDFFGIVGSSRGLDEKTLIGYFTAAFAEDSLSAFKLLFWARDVRGGAGERQAFRVIMRYMASVYTYETRQMLCHVPEFGRWDDYLVFFGTPLERDALKTIAEALLDGNGLCAKWMPRKGDDAKKLRAYMQIKPKTFRKLLVESTNVVETAMCAKDYSAVDYSKLPSLASSRYQKAFQRNDVSGYNAYIDKLESGESTINAGAVYPYDVIKSLVNGNVRVANAQWKALPNYLSEGDTSGILPVVDVSGSMLSSVGSVKSTLTCLDVAISLGLYLSERMEGKFKDAFITFSETPQLQVVSGSLSDRFSQMSKSKWDMTTNLESVFDLVLGQAVKFNLEQKDMPSTVLILSDMQFNRCIRDSKSNVLEMMKLQFAEAGYKMPKVVFWNLNSSLMAGQSPVQVNDEDTALVSGFSPAIMKAILSASEYEEEIPLSPEVLMAEVVNSERYANIKLF
jgi:hypothetical protein